MYDHNPFETHEVDISIRLAETPWPSKTRNPIGGRFRIPAYYLDAMMLKTDGRETALASILQSMERLLRQTEVLIREAWGMETVEAKRKREYEERRYAMIHARFTRDAGPLYAVAGGKTQDAWLRFVNQPVQVPESEDWPLLGEVIG